MEKFQLIISILSTMFTAVAAVASFYAARAASKSNKINLEEIRKRDKPVLDVPSKKFKGVLLDNLLSQWDGGDENHLKNGAADYFLDLNNIGNIHARNVVMYFEYEGLEDFVKEYSNDGFVWTREEDNQLSFYLEKNKRHNFYFINFHHFSPSEKISNKIRVAITSQYENLGTVQPSKYNTESTKVHLPLFYVLLLNFNQFALNNLKIFDLYLILEYIDPYGLKYKQKFNIKPLFSRVEHTPGSMEFFGKVICQEVTPE
ncbi:hypothetical protein [Bacillus haynesii]|uniref:hypothetical protein n=1 Tax=Bacillus haynesii TaxID=1925021 RepID=UPI00228070E1|nr:hypothetical protein [Bacillus haynesii]MCY7789862.1 hypothetical protein [Bacillus haynesii]